MQPRLRWRASSALPGPLLTSCARRGAEHDAASRARRARKAGRQAPARMPPGAARAGARTRWRRASAHGVCGCGSGPEQCLTHSRGGAAPSGKLCCVAGPARVGVLCHHLVARLQMLALRWRPHAPLRRAGGRVRRACDGGDPHTLRAQHKAPALGMSASRQAARHKSVLATRSITAERAPSDAGSALAADLARTC